MIRIDGGTSRPYCDKCAVEMKELTRERSTNTLSWERGTDVMRFERVEGECPACGKQDKWFEPVPAGQTKGGILK